MGKSRNEATKSPGNSLWSKFSASVLSSNLQETSHKLKYTHGAELLKCYQYEEINSILKNHTQNQCLGSWRKFQLLESLCQGISKIWCFFFVACVSVILLCCVPSPTSNSYFFICREQLQVTACFKQHKVLCLLEFLGILFSLGFEALYYCNDSVQVKNLMT